MASIKLRSSRGPEFRLPAALGPVVFAASGYYGHARLSGLVERLGLIGATDPRAALVQAVYWLRTATLVYCALLALFCLLMLRSCQLARRECRLPPSGWRSYGSLYAKTGERARRLARFGQWLAGLLLIASAGLAVAVEYTVRLLLAGRFAL